MKAISQGIQRGIITAYTDGSFRLNQKITRSEMIVMLARALEILKTDTEHTSFEDDAAIPNWTKGAVAVLYEIGLVTGREHNNFKPNDAATRAEAIVMIIRSLEMNR